MVNNTQAFNSQTILVSVTISYNKVIKHNTVMFLLIWQQMNQDNQLLCQLLKSPIGIVEVKRGKVHLLYQEDESIVIQKQMTN